MANREYCESCEKLKKENADFILNGVTEAICASLMSNTGLTKALGHKNCEDLKDIVECLIGQQLDKIEGFDICDWETFTKEFLANLKTTLDALVCSDCGQWLEIEKLWIEIGKIWEEINNIKNQLHSLLSNNYVIETRYQIIQSTSGMSINIDRKGNFEFNWSDWINSNFVGSSRYGTGKIIGKVDLCMSPSGSEAIYKIRSITINTISYQKGTATADTAPTITIKTPNSSGTQIYTKQLTSTFTDVVNKTIGTNIEGTLGHGSNSGWINFIHIFVNWIIDDEINLQVMFINNNREPVPSC